VLSMPVALAAVVLALPGPAAGRDSPDLDSLITAAMSQYHIPAVSACVVKGEDVVWHGAYGFARLADSVVNADTTVFDLASVSKTATAGALMQLWERGVFGLDDDVSGYLPFPVRHPGYPDSAITFRMLLTHTSGIIDNWPVFERLLRQGDPDVPLRAFVEGYLVPGGEYYDSTANFASWPPGAQYRYCNLAIALAGYLVEALADSFHNYTRDSLFLPLGMTRTVWYFADIDTNTMAMPYRYSGGAHIPYGHQSMPDIPAGTMKSSTLQLARYLIAMLHYGRCGSVRVLDSATVELMTTVQHPSQVGLVWHQARVGTREVWCHGGAWNGISTWIGFCRRDSTAAVVLANLGGVNGVIQGTIVPALFDCAGVAEPGSGHGPQPLPRATLARNNLRLEGDAPGRLLDASGRFVAWLSPGDNDLSGFGPGVYFIRTGTGRAASKLVIP